MISDQTLKDVVSKVFLHGKDQVAKDMNLSVESVSRYVRLAKERGLLSEVYGLAERKPNVLVLDIETTPIIGSFWRIGKGHINHEQIIRDVHLLSYAVKWLFEPDVYGEVLTPEEAINADDSRITKNVWSFVDKADIIIAHNGIRFDLSMLTTRFMMHDLNPPSPYQVIDTLKVFQREANFSSNKQGYLNQVLALTKKMEHDGLELWHRCIRGEQDALDVMLAYNKQDVIGLEELYVKVRPYVKSHPNMALYYHNDTEGNADRCHRCLSKDITWLTDQPYVTPLNRYTSYRCNACGGVGRSRVSEVDKKERLVLTSSIAR